MSTFRPSAQFTVGTATYFMATPGAVVIAPIGPNDGAIINITNPDAPTVYAVSSDHFVDCDADKGLTHYGRHYEAFERLWIRPASSLHAGSFNFHSPGGEQTVFTYPGFINIRMGRVPQLSLEESRAQLEKVPHDPTAREVIDYRDESLHPTARMEFMLGLLEENHYYTYPAQGIFAYLGYIATQPDLLIRAIRVCSLRLLHADSFGQGYPGIRGYEAFYEPLQGLIGLPKNLTIKHGPRSVRLDPHSEDFLPNYRKALLMFIGECRGPETSKQRNLAALSLGIVGE